MSSGAQPAWPAQHAIVRAMSMSSTTRPRSNSRASAESGVRTDEVDGIAGLAGGGAADSIAHRCHIGTVQRLPCADIHTEPRVWRLTGNSSEPRIARDVSYNR